MEKLFKIGTPSKRYLPEWDLSVAFYEGLDDPQIEKDKKELKKVAKEISLYRDEICELAPYELSILLRKYENLIENSRKLTYFAHLYSDTHKTDEKASQFQSKVKKKFPAFLRDSALFTLS